MPNKSNFSQKATTLAYQVSQKAKYDAMKDNFKINYEQWEVLTDSSKHSDTNQYDYKAVAFVNRATKEIHIASAGTKPTEKYDLIDDGFVAFGRVPYKIYPAKAMVEQVIQLVGGEAKAADYTFSTSGHSLGAIISDLTGVEIMSRGLSFDTSTTFDNPGTKPIIERAIKNNLFTNKVEATTEELTKHSEVYNAKPNFINNSNTQFGNAKLVLPNKDSAKDTTESSSGVWGFGKYLYNKVGSTVKTCSDYLGVTKVVQQIDDHSLKNFADMENDSVVIDTDNWQKVNGKLVVEKFSGYDKLTSTGNDVILFNQEVLDSMVIVDKKEFGYNDLLRSPTCAQEYANNSQLAGESNSFLDNAEFVY